MTARNAPAPPTERHGNTAATPMIVCALCASLLTAVGPALVVPHFAAVFTSFGARLPFITQIVVEHPYVFWAAPAITLLIWRLWPDRSRGALFALLFAFATLPVSAAIVIFALYLPIFRLGATIG